MNRILAPILFLALGLSFACSKSEDDDVQKLFGEFGGVVDSLQKMAAEQAGEFNESFAPMLQGLDKELEGIKTDAGKLGEEASAEWQQVQREFEVKRGEIDRELENLRKRGSKEWEQGRDELLRKYESLKRRVEEEAGKLKG